jgi:hypothetical protein
MPRLTVKAITPKNIPSTKEYMSAVDNAAMKTGRLIESDLKATTRTWTHKPQFMIQVAIDNGDYIITAGTDSLIYLFVNEGTRPHPIVAVRSRYLRFSSGYRAKTRVGIIGSQEGGSFGDTRFAQRVQHPGFPGRRFTLTIQRRRQKTLEQEESQAIAKVNRTMK